MKSRSFSVVVRNAFLAFLLVLLCSVIAHRASAQPATTPAAAASQKIFDTPQQAATALIQACDPYDAEALLEIFGPDGKDFVSSADPVRDKNLAGTFAEKARQKNDVEMDPQNPARAILNVGNDGWPFPVPLVKKNGKWHFDAKEGHDELLVRRIGANELDAIQICRGYVDAQQEYASEVHDDSGIHQYAQKIISTPGKRDGLVWRNQDGTLGGPISDPIAQAMQEGYSGSTGRAYHGYYFKILKGQGTAAPLGRLDYVIEGVMIGGFALVAVPAEYRVTGVKTFMVSYNGLVYQKDLGPDSLKIVKDMQLYNPDKTWHVTDDEWPSD
jgi:hypothetical protein